MSLLTTPLTRIVGAATELGVDVAPRTRLLKLALAPRRTAGVRVKTVNELLQKLRDEARVI